jgi:hypothetical protein
MPAINDRSATGEEEQQPLYKGPERTGGSGQGMDKKKKMIIGGVVGGVVLIGVILIIVFSVGGGDKPGPSPEDPAFEHFNPYSLDGALTDTESGYAGELSGTFHSTPAFLLAQ